MVERSAVAFYCCIKHLATVQTETDRLGVRLSRRGPFFYYLLILNKIMKDKKVDKYINKFEGEKKKILKKLRSIILKARPSLKEEMKMGVPWYGGLFYLVGLKDHVNMGFCFKGLKKHEKDLEGKGKYMRHIKFYTMKDINERKLVKMIKLTKKPYKCH